MNITLKQLRAFTALAHERSFTHASETLHVTQSTLTSAIKALEGEIGIRLFDRSTRFCELTPQGARFLPAAQRMLRDLGESLEEVREVAGLQRGSVAVAAAASFINFVLAQAVVDMARSHPAIGVRLVEEITSGVCRLVTDGEVDFGVTSLFAPAPDLDT
ncbi:MAG TPA: LysR family transcriptional regulator, partial [Burkholderiaceae bacterium]